MGNCVDSSDMLSYVGVADAMQWSSIMHLGWFCSGLIGEGYIMIGGDMP